jgi:hypothetical protein
MDDYALVPEREVEELKKEVEDLRKNPVGSTPEGKELMEQVESLNQTIHSLSDFFKEASESLERFESKPKEESKIEPKVDELIEQNKKIAKGIIAVADLVKDLTMKMESAHAEAPKIKQPKPAMPQPSFSPPNMSQHNDQMPPMPDFGKPPKMEMPKAPGSLPEFNDNLPPLPNDLPPLGPTPPPPKPKKKLFGF